MQFHNKDGVRYLTFEIFPSNVVHGVLTRNGGLSPDPWQSLNVGGTVGDETGRVIANRHHSFFTLGRDRESIFDVWQTHSPDVVIANSAHSQSRPRPHFKADAILTDNPAITLFMRFADCTPILLFDPVKKVVGIVHAGWQGTVKKVASNAVKTMHSAFGSSPENVLAAIGPAIGPDHYEVGANVIEQVKYAYGADAEHLLMKKGDKEHFDLWAANRLDLELAGVKNIETAGICTACNVQDWYSHRAEKGRTGRFGALIAINL